MSSERKEQLKKKLTRARETLLDAIRGMDGAAYDRPVYSDGEMHAVAHVLRHVMDAESGMLLNCRNIIAGGAGVPEGFDRDRYNDSRLRKNAAMTPAEVLTRMAENREMLFAFIDEVDDAALDLEGRHAAGEIMSVENHLRMIGLHEKLHAADIRRALAD